MAAPTISATSTLNAFGSTTGSLAVPAGTQDGDILVLVSGSYTGVPVLTPGFTNISVSSSTSGVRASYRVASSEPANYTVTFGSPDGGGAAMFRITGDTTSFFEADNTSTESSSATITKVSPSFLVMFGHTRDNVNHSAYQITDSGSNPTWTELMDISDTTPDQAFFVAYATTTDVTDITAWQFTGDGGTAVNKAQLLRNLSTQAASATGTTFEVTPTFYSGTGTSGSSGTGTTLEVTPTFYTGEAQSGQPTQWTNESEDDSEWTNETV